LRDTTKDQAGAQGGALALPAKNTKYSKCKKEEKQLAIDQQTVQHPIHNTVALLVLVLLLISLSSLWRQGLDTARIACHPSAKRPTKGTAGEQAHSC